MKPKTRKLALGGVQTAPTRVSTRIAERKERLSTQVDTAPKPLAPKAPPKKGSGVTLNPSGRIKAVAADTSAKRLPAPRPSKLPQPRKIQRPQIVRQTLKELEKITAKDPLPEEIGQYKSAPAYIPTDSDTEMSTYDPNMPAALNRFRVYDEMFSGNKLKAPNDLQYLLDKITSPDIGKIDSDQNLLEFKDWNETILEPEFKEDMAGDWFYAYMGIPITRLPTPHFKERNTTWGIPSGTAVRPWTPKPDFVEGIMEKMVPPGILDSLKEHVRPTTRMALPNFMVEYKGKGSMKTAHQQARLDGGIASQGLFRVYDELKEPQNYLNKALVGSMEYNGEIIVGNVHWATKSASKPGGLDYHMRRVLLHGTRGTDVQSFVRNREEARNFRRYFANIREEVLEKLQKLPRETTPERTYDKMKALELENLCQQRHLKKSGPKAKLIERLLAYDATGANPAASVVTSDADSPVTPTNGPASARSYDLRTPMAIDSTTRGRRGRSREENGDKNHERPSKRLHYGEDA